MDVNPENYIAIITGDSKNVKGGNGRVLQSTSEDMVFLNFDDHGEPGVIDFPPDGDPFFTAPERLYAVIFFFK